MEGMPAVVCQREETKDTPTPDEQSISLQHLYPESKGIATSTKDDAEGASYLHPHGTKHHGPSGIPGSLTL